MVVKRAAEIQGRSVSNFVVDAARQAASGLMRASIRAVRLVCRGRMILAALKYGRYPAQIKRKSITPFSPTPAPTRLVPFR